MLVEMCRQLVPYLVMVSSVLFVANGYARADVTLSVNDITEATKADGGYVVRDVIYSSRVVFPASDWKSSRRGYLIDPSTGASLRFAGRSFGRQFQTFLIWGYSAREHQWARQLNQIDDYDDKQARFLTEWVDRALRRQDVGLLDNLVIGHPLLNADQKTASLQPLMLSPTEQPIQVNHTTIGAHRFAHTSVTTTLDIAGRHELFDTNIYISGFMYHPRLDLWYFFAALFHVPSSVPSVQQQKIKDLFVATISSLSIRPPEP